MNGRIRYVVASVVLLPVTIGALAWAAATDEQKCLASKLKAVGKYEFCLFKSYALHTIKGTTAPDFSKCSAKFSLDWLKTETKYTTACPTSGDASTVASLADDHAAEMFDLLNGVEPVCGDGTIEDPETCDGANLGGEDCVSLGFMGGTLSCNGSCQFDESACFHCEPEDCNEAGASCGGAGDGCGGSQSCGTCPTPTQCGWGGTPSQCGGNCTPLTCGAAGATCGQVPDECGAATFTCGTCMPGQICSGNPPQCIAGSSCMPLSIAAACGSRNCGFAANGCGGLVECGTCGSGEGCIYSTGMCSASAPCVPATCADLAATSGTTACSAGGGPASGCFCGAVADGCGSLLDCGECLPAEHCGAAGTNVCE
jgi:hypothetical protein